MQTRCALAPLRALLVLALWAPLATAGQLDSNGNRSKGEPGAWARAAADSEMEPDSIPTRDKSEPGEPLAEGVEPVVWDHFLPFFGQKVTDMGFELPRPYGIAFIGYWQKQDLTIKDLTISADGGATYLHADIDVRGSATLDTSNSGIPDIGDKTVIEYTVFQGNEDRWNALAGVNWEIKKKLNLHLEGGFLGSRSNIITSLTYRW
jgi:hypothetical protein